MSEASARGFLWAGMAGLGLFGIALVVLHALNLGQLAEHGRHVSNFAHMRAWWLWQAGLVGLGLGTILLAAGLQRTLAVQGPATWSFWALRLAGLCGLAMTVYRTDRYATPDGNYTFAGYVHDTCAVMSTFFICWSMLLLISAARIDPAWRNVPGRSWLWPLATIALALAWMGGDVTQYWPIAAVVQRGVVVLMLAWLFTTGWRALSVQALSSGMPQPVPPPRPTR